MTQRHGVILDIDGTLVDSNDVHTKAWIEVLAEHGYHPAYERVRGLIGMGADNLLPTLIGLAKDSPKGKAISEQRGALFKERYLQHLQPFPQAKELLQHMHDRGLKLAVATSAQPDELRVMLQIIGATDLIEEQASAGDAKKSKPNPDIMQAALERTRYSSGEVVMLGDTAYDIESARKAGIDT
ncbi:MAG: HAD family hydrolase, partial [Chloroflexota bacterium]|nr:HAD family hydrolase [Chloroflexota bacterium]